MRYLARPVRQWRGKHTEGHNYARRCRLYRISGGKFGTIGTPPRDIIERDLESARKELALAGYELVWSPVTDWWVPVKTI